MNCPKCKVWQPLIAWLYRTDACSGEKQYYCPKCDMWFWNEQEKEHDATDDLPKFIEYQRDMEVGSDRYGEPID